MKSYIQGEIIRNIPVITGIYDMILSVPEIAKEAKAGQFVHIYTGRGEMPLPRPISICEIYPEEGQIRLLFQVAGKGTAFFSSRKAGDTIMMLGPLGNGFLPQKAENHVIIGGGIGIPPLLELVKNLTGKKQVFLGSKSQPILEREFTAYGSELYIATDDGSAGFHGTVLDLLKKVNPTTDAVYACGPKVMLEAVCVWALEKGINPEISMEERMACGIGACVGCTVRIQKEGEPDWQYLKVCKDGPVFFGREVIWNE